jgi:hypothetical protein
MCDENSRAEHFDDNKTCFVEFHPTMPEVAAKVNVKELSYWLPILKISY